MEKKRLFDISERKEEAQASSLGLHGKYVSKYLLAHYQKVEAVKKDISRLPEAEEFFFLQSNNAFNAFTFIPVVLEQASCREMFVTTYSINKRVLNALVELHKSGGIDQITLLISDTILQRNPMVSDLLSAVNKQYANINILFAWVHAKVCLIKTDSSYYVVEGSGNWSENAYYEQYVLANSKGLYDFRKKLFTEVQIRHKIINGEIIKL